MLIKYKTQGAELKKVELYEVKARINELQSNINTSHLRRFLPLVMKAGEYRGELKTLTKAQYKKFLHKEARPAILNKSDRIPWHYALDELAAESGYNSDEQFKEAIEKLSSQIAELKQLRSGKSNIKDDITKRETTKPQPETIKSKSMEPPVFNKQENTNGEVTTLDGLEVTSRRNPSFWQTEVDDKSTEKSPDAAYRIRYKADADKLTRAALRDAQDKMIVKTRARLSGRMPRLSPHMPRISPKMPKLR